MRKLAGLALNTIFFTIVILLAFVMATISLTKKVNEARAQYDRGLKGAVIKQVVPVMSFSRGIVKKIHVRVGQEVKKNDLIIELENPELVGKIKALQNYPDNVSAQTEARVAEEELKGLRIFSPINGVVTEVLATEGSPVDGLTEILTIDSNDNILLLANLTDDQYLAVQSLQEARAYSKRLNQNFVIQPDILQPDVKLNDVNVKSIGLFFTFKDKDEAASLLNNEDLELQLIQKDTNAIKPMDYIVNFWNALFSSKTHGK